MRRTLARTQAEGPHRQTTPRRPGSMCSSPPIVQSSFARPHIPRQEFRSRAGAIVTAPSPSVNRRTWKSATIRTRHCLGPRRRLGQSNAKRSKGWARAMAYCRRGIWGLESRQTTVPSQGYIINATNIQYYLGECCFGLRESNGASAPSRIGTSTRPYAWRKVALQTRPRRVNQVCRLLRRHHRHHALDT